jgi:hypothetical protein
MQNERQRVDTAGLPRMIPHARLRRPYGALQPTRAPDFWKFGMKIAEHFFGLLLQFGVVGLVVPGIFDSSYLFAL